MAVERNGDIVPKAQYSATTLADGDVVEIVRFVGGADMGLLPTPAAWQAALEARHGQALQAKFSAATVAICGLGGLGSHLALFLARAGVGEADPPGL